LVIIADTSEGCLCQSTDVAQSTILAMVRMLITLLTDLAMAPSRGHELCLCQVRLLGAMIKSLISKDHSTDSLVPRSVSNVSFYFTVHKELDGKTVQFSREHKVHCTRNVGQMLQKKLWLLFFIWIVKHL